MSRFLKESGLDLPELATRRLDVAAVLVTSDFGVLIPPMPLPPHIQVSRCAD